MKVLLLLALGVAALVVAGWWLLPVLAAHAPGVIGALGVLLLLLALVLPRKRRCEGFHCSGCNHH